MAARILFNQNLQAVHPPSLPRLQKVVSTLRKEYAASTWKILGKLFKSENLNTNKLRIINLAFEFLSVPATCAGCLCGVNEGVHHPAFVNSTNSWTSEECTRLVETNNYGQLNFPGCKTKTANVTN